MLLVLYGLDKLRCIIYNVMQCCKDCEAQQRNTNASIYKREQHAWPWTICPPPPSTQGSLMCELTHAVKLEGVCFDYRLGLTCPKGNWGSLRVCTTQPSQRSLKECVCITSPHLEWPNVGAVHNPIKIEGVCWHFLDWPVPREPARGSLFALLDLTNHLTYIIITVITIG